MKVHQWSEKLKPNHNETPHHFRKVKFKILLASNVGGNMKFQECFSGVKTYEVWFSYIKWKWSCTNFGQAGLRNSVQVHKEACWGNWGIIYFCNRQKNKTCPLGVGEGVDTNLEAFLRQRTVWQPSMWPRTVRQILRSLLQETATTEKKKNKCDTANSTL